MLVFDKNRKKKQLQKFSPIIFSTSSKQVKLSQKKKFKRYLYLYKLVKPLFFDSSLERNWFYSVLSLRKRKTRKKLFFFNKRKQLFLKKKLFSFVNRNSFRRFGFFRWRRYFLVKRLRKKVARKFLFKKERRSFLNKNNLMLGKNRGLEKKVLNQYKQRMLKFLINNEILLRYSFFNNLKAPLLARVMFGPFLSVLSKVVRLDLLAHLKYLSVAPYDIQVGFKFLNNKNLSASVILKYLLSRLNLLYLPREIIPRLMGRLLSDGRSKFKIHPRKNRGKKRAQLVKGILFKCAGRFTRAQMASYKAFKNGRVPLSTLSVNIKYAFGTLSLKYGSLGLKVFVVT